MEICWAPVSGKGAGSPLPLGHPVVVSAGGPVCGKTSLCFVRGLFAGPRFVLLPEEAWQAAPSLQKDCPLWGTGTPQVEGMQRDLAEDIVLLLCGGHMWGCGARALDKSCPHTPPPTRTPRRREPMVKFESNS